MARGTRKSPIEKIKEELDKIQVSINQHRDAIEELKEQERALNARMKEEQLKEVSLMVTSILDEKKMSVSELKNILENTDKK
jgi:UDP-N-acetyl-D-mannosaminuronate dehydrogenase